jgi:hypothetical protein
VDVVAGELPLGSAYLRQGQPAPAIPLLLPAGARRLAVIVSGAQGTALVEEARLVPQALIPRGMRDAFAWPRVPEPDRYRVGPDDVRTTCLDRMSPTATASVCGRDGAFWWMRRATPDDRFFDPAAAALPTTRCSGTGGGSRWGRWERRRCSRRRPGG